MSIRKLNERREIGYTGAWQSNIRPHEASDRNLHQTVEQWQEHIDPFADFGA